MPRVIALVVGTRLEYNMEIEFEQSRAQGYLILNRHLYTRAGVRGLELVSFGSSMLGFDKLSSEA